MFHIEDQFDPYAPRFIPVLIELVQSPDQTTQKVSIDAFNAMATTVKERVIQFRVDILQALKPIKSHKVKPVREASLWTIKLLRELDPPLVEHELAILDELPTARRQTSMNKSPIRAIGSMVSARGDTQSKKAFAVTKQDVAAFDVKPLTDRPSTVVEP
jgi:hypothetical protein